MLAHISDRSKSLQALEDEGTSHSAHYKLDAATSSLRGQQLETRLKNLPRPLKDIWAAHLHLNEKWELLLL